MRAVKNVLRSCLFAAVALATTLQAWADPLPQADWRDVCVLAFAGPQAWQQDLATVGEPLATLLPAFLATQSGVDALTGWDGTRRSFVVLRTDGITLAPVLAIPVTDASVLIAAAKPCLGEVTGTGQGQWKIGRREWTALAQHHDGWLFVAQTEVMLRPPALPDTTATLARVDERFDCGALVDWQAMPATYRTWAIDKLRERSQAALATGSGQPDQDRLQRLWFASLERLLRDVAEIACGARYDEQGRLMVEISLRPRADSPLAQLRPALFQGGLASDARWLQHPPRSAKLAEQRCLHVELNLNVPANFKKRFEQVFFADLAMSDGMQAVSGTSSEAPNDRAAGWLATLLQQAAAAWQSAKLQAALSVDGHRPPAQLTFSADGGAPPLWLETARQALHSLRIEDGRQSEAAPPQPAAPLVPSDASQPDNSGQAGQAWELPLATSGWLRNLAGPNGTVLAGGHDDRFLAGLGEQPRTWLVDGVTTDRAAPEQRTDENQPQQLFQFQARTAALARLASIVAEDWQAKANLGKVALILPPDRDQLKCELVATGDAFVLRMELDRSLTQAAALGASLLLLQPSQ